MRNGSQPPRQMMPGPPPPPEEPQEPPTIEGLQKQLTRLSQYAELFRQQRDQSVALANDLQVDMAVAKNTISELEKEVAELSARGLTIPMSARPPTVVDPAK